MTAPFSFLYLSERMDLARELAQAHVEEFGTLVRDKVMFRNALGFYRRKVI